MSPAGALKRALVPLLLSLARQFEIALSVSRDSPDDQVKNSIRPVTASHFLCCLDTLTCWWGHHSRYHTAVGQKLLDLFYHGLGSWGPPLYPRRILTAGFKCKLYVHRINFHSPGSLYIYMYILLLKRDPKLIRDSYTVLNSFRLKIDPLLSN